MLRLLLIILVVLGSTPQSALAATRAEVREIQTLLNQLGYQAGGADGLMGQRTRAAIRSYQADAALLQDGRPSSQLLDHLRERAPAAANPVASVPAAPPPRTTATAPPPRTAVTSVPRGGGGRATAGAAADGPALASATVLRAAGVYPSPARGTAQGRQLRAGESVQVMERNGLWLRIKADSDGTAGWCSLTHLRLGGASGQTAAATAPAAPRQQSGGWFSEASRSLTSWLSGPSSSQNASPTATIGIRGLTAADLGNARAADSVALARLDRLSATEAQARGFARSANLSSRRIAYPQSFLTPPASTGAPGGAPSGSVNER